MARRGKHRVSQSACSSQIQLARGGRFRPLLEAEVRQVTDTAFRILEMIGMAGLPLPIAQALRETGAVIRTDGRVCFARSMVEDAIARAPNSIDLPGFLPDRGISVGGGHVHIGTGGAAVQVLEAETLGFHDAKLADLLCMMRVLDRCANIHYGVRPLVARDVPDPLELDVNTAFACLKGTSKPIGVSFQSAANLDVVVDLFDCALGQPGGFRRQPFCLGVIVHVVPPLRYAPEGVETLEACVRAGMVPQICSAGQAGATSPVTLAGALAQGLAECLAGLMLVDHFRAGAPCIYAFMPFVSDLRTGAMTGGGGESAVANAAAAQLLAHLSLPSTVSAGMTDAKTADAQAGYEKGHTIALSAHAGADMINLSVGMLGSIMVASPEAMVIDDDMCGAILRAVRGIEVSSDTLDIESIERVVTGDGHYLGEAETLARMKSDYVYPELADRRSVGAWQDAGCPSIWDRARGRVREILDDPPTHLTREAENRIRQSFPVRPGH